VPMRRNGAAEDCVMGPLMLLANTAR
jgi:hypothetical protein